MSFNERGKMRETPRHGFPWKRARPSSPENVDHRIAPEIPNEYVGTPQDPNLFTTVKGSSSLPILTVNDYASVVDLVGSASSAELHQVAAKATTSGDTVTIPVQISFQPARLTAKEAAEVLRSGIMTVEQYVNRILARQAKVDKLTKVWAHLSHEDIIKDAKRLDEIPKEQRGRLHGVLVGVQDVIHVAGMPTRYGSQAYENEALARTDAASVALLRRHGALIMGKLRTSEFGAKTAAASCVHPYDASRHLGTSAGAAGTAVAQMQISIALHRSSEGELSMTASSAGVFSLKPTWNSISLEGVKPLCPSFDTLGILARTADDLALVADIMLGFDQKRKLQKSLDKKNINDFGKMELQGIKFGFVSPPGSVEEVEKTTLSAFEILRDSGAEVEMMKLGWISSLCRLPLQHVGNSEACVSLANEAASKSKILRGYDPFEHSLPALETKQGLDKIAAARPMLDAAVSPYTAIVTLGACSESQARCQDQPTNPYNDTWTALHCPVITVPGLVGNTGLPIGITLVAARYQDEHLLKVCKVVADLFAEKGGWKSPL